MACNTSWPSMLRRPACNAHHSGANAFHRTSFAIRRQWICCKPVSSNRSSPLGHESIETTQIYLDANLELKEKMLAKTTPPGAKPGLYRPDDALLAFLRGL